MLDYAAIMRAGQSLVPDMRQQGLQDEEMRMRQEAHSMEQAKAQFALDAARQSAEDEQRYAIEATAVFGNPTAHNIRNLQARFPKYSEAISKMWDGHRADQREADVTQLGSMYTLIRSGNFERATELARTRYEADKEAGVADEADREILRILEDGSPAERAKAGGIILFMLAGAVGPEKMGSTFENLSEEERQRDLHWAKVDRAESEATIARAEADAAPGYYDARADYQRGRATISASDARYRDSRNAADVEGRQARTAATKGREARAGQRPATPAPRSKYVRFAKDGNGNRIGFNRKTKKWEPVK